MTGACIVVQIVVCRLCLIRSVRWYRQYSGYGVWALPEVCQDQHFTCVFYWPVARTLCVLARVGVTLLAWMHGVCVY